MWTGVQNARPSPCSSHGDGRSDQHDHRWNQDDQGGHLHLERFDLLTKVFRCASDHQPSHKHGNNGEDEHPIQPTANAAENHFTELNEPHRHQAAQRCVAVVHRVDAAVAGRRGGRRPSSRLGNTKSNFLTLHVSAGLCVAGHLIDSKGSQLGIAGLLSPVTQKQQRHKDRQHRCKHRPTLSCIAHHLTERIAKRSGNQQYTKHLDKPTQGRRIFKGVCGIDVEETSAIGA